MMVAAEGKERRFPSRRVERDVWELLLVEQTLRTLLS
jgi:hypothetical protein